MAAGVKLGQMGPFEFNPQGNIWYKDESTFGHKLLSKMGWTKGKGLGKNEDGIKENLRVSKREHLTGVGWTNNINNAVKCIEYENILRKLEEHFESKKAKIVEPTNESNLESLEQRSKNSKNHLHYQKFVRGKDVMRYSEKDMKCIFFENPQESANGESKEDKKKELQTFDSCLSINDYFAEKMKKKLGASKPKIKEEPAEDDFLKKDDCHNLVSNKKRKKNTDNSMCIKKIKLEVDESLNEVVDPQTTVDAGEESLQYDISKVKHSVKSKNNISKEKSKKSRLRSMQKLKSCIKSNSIYNLDETKNVSFNDTVSYKILDTSIENITELNDTATEEEFLGQSEILTSLRTSDIECNDNGEKAYMFSNGSVDSKLNIYTDEYNAGEHLTASQEKVKELSVFSIEENEILIVPDKYENEKLDHERNNLVKHHPICLDLPKNVGKNFNSWLDSQRQATQMKLYKTMIKKMKKHHILRSTNLLDIKGYGNWGF